MRLVAWVGGRTFASLRNHRNFRLVGQRDLPSALALSSALGAMARIVGRGSAGSSSPWRGRAWRSP